MICTLSDGINMLVELLKGIIFYFSWPCSCCPSYRQWCPPAFSCSIRLSSSCPVPPLPSTPEWLHTLRPSDSDSLCSRPNFLFLSYYRSTVVFHVFDDFLGFAVQHELVGVVFEIGFGSWAFLKFLLCSLLLDPFLLLLCDSKGLLGFVFGAVAHHWRFDSLDFALLLHRIETDLALLFLADLSGSSYSNSSWLRLFFSFSLLDFQQFLFLFLFGESDFTILYSLLVSFAK